MDNYYTIEDVCDIINNYIEESKGNALDKLYGKEVDDALRTSKLHDRAKEQMKQGNISSAQEDYLYNKYSSAKDKLDDKTRKYTKDGTMFHANSLMRRANNEYMKPGDREHIREMKASIGVGKSNMPKNREAGTYLDMHNKAKQKVNYTDSKNRFITNEKIKERRLKDIMDIKRLHDNEKIKRSTQPAKDTNKSSFYDIIKAKYAKNGANESYNDVIDTKLAIYEAYEDGFITESEKYELLDIISDFED